MRLRQILAAFAVIAILMALIPDAQACLWGRLRRSACVTYYRGACCYQRVSCIGPCYISVCPGSTQEQNGCVPAQAKKGEPAVGSAPGAKPSLPAGTKTNQVPSDGEVTVAQSGAARRLRPNQPGGIRGSDGVMVTSSTEGKSAIREAADAIRSMHSQRRNMEISGKPNQSDGAQVADRGMIASSTAGNRSAIREAADAIRAMHRQRRNAEDSSPNTRISSANADHARAGY
jgi:hypothetical protein